MSDEREGLAARLAAKIMASARRDGVLPGNAELEDDWEANMLHPMLEETLTKPASDGVREALERQMEAQADDDTPSSLQRQRGLVWLEGWFDLSALTALPADQVEAERERAWRAAWAAKPVEGFPVEGREQLAAFQYGKDCAVAAIRNLSTPTPEQSDEA